MLSDYQNSGMIEHKIRLNRRVSLAVILVDDFFPIGIPIGVLKVFIREIPSCPIKNLSGYYVFTDLTDGIYTICVASDNYLFVQEVVELNSLNPYEPIVRIILKPNTRYPFPAGTTLVRATVRDIKESPVVGAKVRTTLQTGFAGRLSSRGASDGEANLDIVDITRKIYAGDTFLINDEEESKRECCTANASPLGIVGLQNMTLSGAIKYRHGKGTQLLPIVRTLTSETGEMVMYFRNVLSKKMCILLEISFQEAVYKREVQITEGANVSLGVICL